MLIRIYTTLWIMFLVAATVVWLLDGATWVDEVMFGFVALGMIFLGMINVLPYAVTHSIGRTYDAVARRDADIASDVSYRMVSTGWHPR